MLTQGQWKTVYLKHETQLVEIEARAKESGYREHLADWEARQQNADHPDTPKPVAWTDEEIAQKKQEAIAKVDAMFPGVQAEPFDIPIQPSPAAPAKS